MFYHVYLKNYTTKFLTGVKILKYKKNSFIIGELNNFKVKIKYLKLLKNMKVKEHFLSFILYSQSYVLEIQKGEDPMKF